VEDKVKKVLKTRPWATVFPEKGRTKQSFKDQCDMNNIMQSLNTGNVVGHVSNKIPKYGNAPSDFQDLQNIVAAAKTDYEELSPGEQQKFDGFHGYIDAILEASEADTEQNSENESSDMDSKNKPSESAEGAADSETGESE